MSEERTTTSGGAHLSPYDLVFGSAPFEEGHFPGIGEEAEARGVDTGDPEQFIMLGTVGALLRELLPEESGTDEFTRLGALIYQAFNFWRNKKPSFELSEAEIRDLIDSPPDSAQVGLVPPSSAGYFQLPRHLFWARIEEDATPEPIDGFFWTVTPRTEASGTEAPGQTGPRLELLLTLGLFPGRPGFSTIVVGAELDMDLAEIDVMRREGEEFENILPGGELQGWYGLVTEQEVLRLVSRIFDRLSAGDGGGKDGS